jgi:hypothetical protein
MIIDELLEFCDATSAVINVGNAIIGDVIDLGAAGINMGQTGKPVYLVIQVDTAFSDAADAGTATIQFQLASDSTANLATSKTIHIDTGAIPIASLVAGYEKIYPLPISDTYERYVGLWETVATTNLDAGKINAFLTLDPPSWKPVSDGLA